MIAARSGAARALITAGVVALLAAVTWHVDADVAARSQAYYMGGLDRMLVTANLPARTGAVMLRENGEPLENTPTDDIGYMLGAQLLSFAGLQVTGSLLAAAHNLLFVCGATLAAAALAVLFGSAWLGVAAGVGLLTVGYELRHLLYAQVSNHTIIATFPPMVIAALAWLSADRGGRRRIVVPVLVFGILFAAIDLARHGHGLSVLGTFLLWYVLTARERIGLVPLLANLAAGYVLVAVVFTGALKLHRDMTMGVRPAVVRTLEPPPRHHLFYTLLAGIGHYPNSLGLLYEDKSVDDYIETAVPERPMDTQRLISSARNLYLQYALNYPIEYAASIVRGAFDLPPFIAYVSFTADRRWELGWPAVMPGIAVDQFDRSAHDPSLLMNPKWSYVRASAAEWALFAAAWVILAIAAFVSVRRRVSARDRLMVGAVLYLAWVALPRVLIPIQGTDLVVVFWVSAIVAAVYLTDSALSLRDRGVPATE